MKSLKLYFESILDDDDIFLDPENDKKVVEEWINENYNIYHGDLIISDDFIASCDGQIDVKNKSIEHLTNGLFRWGKIGNDFNCAYCNNLISLEGAPEKVGGNFYCSYCVNLTDISRLPKKKLEIRSTQ